MWTCNPETGAIFDGEGTLIGVADKSSAVSIVAMHNREMGAKDWARSEEKQHAHESGSRVTGVYTDETHVWTDEEREQLPPLWINETDYRP